jgi:hypothetical protein
MPAAAMTPPASWAASWPGEAASRSPNTKAPITTALTGSRVSITGRLTDSAPARNALWSSKVPRAPAVAEQRQQQPQAKQLLLAGSTGLGLDIARRIAESSGGTLTVGRSALGGGAVTVGFGPPAGLGEPGWRHRRVRRRRQSPGEVGSLRTQ